jgi:hypothetical protein
VRRGDASFEDERISVDWIWKAAGPFALFVVGVAVVLGLVFSGAVQGHKTYEAPKAAPTTEQTIVINP